METLDQFIKRAQSRDWPTNAYVIEPGWDHIYVRYGPRAASGRIYRPVLDLANIQVEEALRGTGVFTALVNRLRTEYPGLHLFVELTHKRFGDRLLKMGFIDVTDQAYASFLHSFLLEAAP